MKRETLYSLGNINQSSTSYQLTPKLIAIFHYLIDFIYIILYITFLSASFYNFLGVLYYSFKTPNLGILGIPVYHSNF